MRETKHKTIKVSCETCGAVRDVQRSKRPPKKCRPCSLASNARRFNGGPRTAPWAGRERESRL